MSDLDTRAAARVGSVLNDKWTLERLVGVGGMAAVYAGVHRNGAKAAVKILHPHLAAIPEVRERFLREGKAANKVDHPGVVKVLDDDTIREGPDEGAAYLVMELLDGMSMEDRLEMGPPIGELEMLRILRAVLEVLEAAHTAGVIHRDLKPENLLLLRQGTPEDPKVKVLDFGLARLTDNRIRTQAGLALGTPSYMPPEQASGRQEEIDGRSDIFSLGATAFRVLANRTIHPGNNAVEIALEMSSKPAPKLRTVAPQVSEEGAAIIDRACQFAREDRYQDAKSMLADVRRVLSTPSFAGAASKPVAPPPPALARPGAPKLQQPVSISSSILESIHIPGLPRKTKGRRSLIPFVTVVVLAICLVQVALDTIHPPEQTTTSADAGFAIAPEEASTLAVADVIDVRTVDVIDASEADVVDAGEDVVDAAIEDASIDASDASIKDAGAKKDAGVKKDAGHVAPKPTTTIKKK